MRIGNIVYKARCRKVWQDPVRKIRTLEGFSQTETDGGHDILAAAKHIADPKLKEHFLRHAEDELRHGEMFARRAKELREIHPVSADQTEPDKLYDMSRNREEGQLDAHGFFTAGLFDDLGEVSYVAMLHAAEKKAASIFEVHRDLTKDDPETCRIFEEILLDEKYHVAYTGTFLTKWTKDGRGKEVKEASSAASGSRFMGAWKRAGIRAGAGFGRVMMFVFYFTALAPFALGSKLQKRRQGWIDDESAPPKPPLEQARSQYES